MSAAEEELAAALRASVAVNKGQQLLTEESRLLLAALLREEMRGAVAEGIQAAMTSEQFWAKVFAVLQKQATERTGRFILGGLTSMAKKLFWVALLMLAIYSVGGWKLLTAVWAAMTKAG